MGWWRQKGFEYAKTTMDRGGKSSRMIQKKKNKGGEGSKAAVGVTVAVL